LVRSGSALNQRFPCGVIGILIAVMAAPAAALEFGATYFMGDSLTDSGAYAGSLPAGGGARFTVDPGPVWSEHLARHFGKTARANNPNNPSGTDPQGSNYAQGGARVVAPGALAFGIVEIGVPVSTQIDWALAARPTADAAALYSVWAGSNDVFAQMDRLAAGATEGEVRSALLDAAASLADQVRRLDEWGARYVLVPNLPDIGDTPNSILTAIELAGADNPNRQRALAEAVDALIRPAASPAEQAAVRASAVSAAAARLGIPQRQLQAVVDQVSADGRELSTGFNRAAATALAGTDANVIPLDIHTFFKETLADPAARGLANVTGPLCTADLALSCTVDTLRVPGAEQAYLFADSVHPGPLGHRLIADYAIAVIEAPALAAGLAELPLATGRMHQAGIERHIAAAHRGTPVGDWSLIVGGGGGARDADATPRTLGYAADFWGLTLGGGTRAGEAWYAGVAAGVSDTDAGFDQDRGGFDLRGYYLSAFADYRSGIWFGHAIGTLVPRLDLDDVTRRLRLGPQVLREAGDADGDGLAFKLLLGAGLFDREGLRAGPTVGLNYQQVRIDGYSERDSRSTSMGFLGQDTESLLLEAGLFVEYVAATGGGDLSVRAALVRQEELMDDGREVSAYLKTLPQQRFTLYDVPARDGAWNLDLSLSTPLDRDLGLVLGYRWRNGDEGEREHYGNLGLRLTF
jgi:outer membrane lipase/esterase